MPLVLSVFCNLFFKLTLAGLHVLALNQSLYLSFFFLLRLLFWRIHPDHPRWTAGFFFSLRTQRWTEECWGTLCLSVLVWHKRGSVCPTMHCSCLLFCLEGTRFLVAFKQFRAEAKYFPLWVPQGQPCPSLAICFLVCSGHRRPCWSPYPPKNFSTSHPTRANRSLLNHALLVQYVSSLNCSPRALNWTW